MVGFNVSVSPALTSCTSAERLRTSFASVYPSHAGINRIKADLLRAPDRRTPVSLCLSDNTCTVAETIMGGI